MTTSTATTTTATRPMLDEVAGAARAAFATTVASTAAERSAWLTAVADALDGAAAELIPLADEESHLGTARLTGELARTTAQLRLFASAVVEGSYLEATVDHPDPSTTPPRPDLRRMLRPLGPVAVFSASNFPFAFSVAGGDTASALAAGCPVIVKGHSAHPRLSRRTAEIVAEALATAGAPDGVFGHVEGRETGVALVQHREIRAVGFTGSLHGGRALFDLASSRPDPIPFYGELSAVNPVLITAAALDARADQLASGLAGSFTLGAGQFCTNPGRRVRAHGLRLRRARGRRRRAARPGADADRRDRGGLRRRTHRTRRARRGGGGRGRRGPAARHRIRRGALDDDGGRARRPRRAPRGVLRPLDPRRGVRRVDDALAAIRSVGGSLTATVHAEPGEDLADILAVLTEVAGRVLFAGWPTGVAVSWAQQHGGPWPSTTSIHTSVGVTAIRRFLRPVAYQDAPDVALPAELRESNPLGIPRRVDGVLVVPGSPGD